MKTKKLLYFGLVLLLTMLACKASLQGSPSPAGGEPVTLQPTSPNSASVPVLQDTPTVQVQVQPLNVTTLWFYQEPMNIATNTVDFTFLVENLNKNVAVEDTEYQVIAYDAANTVVGTTTARVGLIFPGETLPAFSITSLTVKEQSIVASLEVKLTQPGQAYTYNSSSPFATSQVTFFPDAKYPQVSGIIQNRLTDTDLDSVGTAAIAYDDKDNIIAAGDGGSGSFIPAGGSIGAVVYLQGYGVPAKIKLFPYLDHFWGLKKSTQEPEPVQLVKAGMISNESGEVSYGFVAKNTDPVNGRMNFDYSVIGSDQNGMVLTVENGDSLAVVFPSEELGFTSDFLHIPDGTRLAKIEVQLWSSADPEDAMGIKNANLSAIPITAEQATFVPGDHGSKVTCILKNSWSKDVTSAAVTVLGYDDNGVLMNSGMTDLSGITVPAGGQTAVEIDMGPNKPAQLEVYPMIMGFLP